MKKLALLTAILFALCCCTNQAPEEKTELDETAKLNIEVVKKLLKAAENEDIDAWKEVVSEGTVIHGPQHDYYDTLTSEGIQEWFNNVDSLKFDVIKILYDVVEEGDLIGDWVLLWCYESWYSVKDEKKVKILWHAPMRIEGGKIVYMASYWNQWDLYKQLGAELEWEDDDDDHDYDDDDDD